MCSDATNRHLVKESHQMKHSYTHPMPSERTFLSKFTCKLMRTLVLLRMRSNRILLVTCQMDNCLAFYVSTFLLLDQIFGSVWSCSSDWRLAKIRVHSDVVMQNPDSSISCHYNSTLTYFQTTISRCQSLKNIRDVANKQYFDENMLTLSGA